MPEHNIHETAHIGKNVSFKGDITIHKDVKVGNNVTFYPNVTIGENTRILDGAVIGRPPIRAGGNKSPPQYR